MCFWYSTSSKGMLLVNWAGGPRRLESSRCLGGIAKRNQFSRLQRRPKKWIFKILESFVLFHKEKHKTLELLLVNWAGWPRRLESSRWLGGNREAKSIFEASTKTEKVDF